jgi:hypothetical protein
MHCVQLNWSTNNPLDIIKYQHNGSKKKRYKEVAVFAKSLDFRYQLKLTCILNGAWTLLS